MHDVYDLQQIIYLMIRTCVGPLSSFLLSIPAQRSRVNKPLYQAGSPPQPCRPCLPPAHGRTEAHSPLQCHPHVFHLHAGPAQHNSVGHIQGGGGVARREALGRAQSAPYFVNQKNIT